MEYQSHVQCCGNPVSSTVRQINLVTPDSDGNNPAFTVRDSGESGTTVIGTIRSRTSRHGRPDRPALDELRLGEGLAAVVLAAGHIVCPAHDAAHHLLGVPADVGD